MKNLKKRGRNSSHQFDDLKTTEIKKMQGLLFVGKFLFVDKVTNFEWVFSLVFRSIKFHSFLKFSKYSRHSRQFQGRETVKAFTLYTMGTVRNFPFRSHCIQWERFCRFS
jgi:hypothetical protein